MAATTLRAAQILETTCLQLTQGQFLDIAYETREDLGLADYWPMVGGKTAALIAACTELGALVAGVPGSTQARYRNFGLNLGLAFQVLDDYLGIWGEPAKTGKSAASDLLEGKKSLPVLFGLSQGGDFARRWAQGPFQPQEVAGLAAPWRQEGAQSYTQGERQPPDRRRPWRLCKTPHPRGSRPKPLPPGPSIAPTGGVKTYR